MASKEHIDIVFQAISELTDNHGCAKRMEIHAATGLKLSIVDECVKDLLEDTEKIVKLRAGVCAAKPMFEEFPCSATELKDGRLKCETGDQTWTLTPIAVRSFAKLFAGYVLLNGK